MRWHVSNIFAVKVNTARLSFNQPHQRFEPGGFADAIAPEQVVTSPILAQKTAHAEYDCRRRPD